MVIPPICELLTKTTFVYDLGVWSEIVSFFEMRVSEEGYQCTYDEEQQQYCVIISNKHLASLSATELMADFACFMKYKYFTCYANLADEVHYLYSAREEGEGFCIAITFS